MGQEETPDARSPHPGPISLALAVAFLVAGAPSAGPADAQLWCRRPAAPPPPFESSAFLRESQAASGDVDRDFAAQPLGLAGETAHLTLAAPGAPGKPTTSVSLFEQGLIQVLQAAVTGLPPEQPYVLALSRQADGGGKRECDRSDPPDRARRRAGRTPLPGGRPRNGDSDREAVQVQTPP